ncbi:hypothetical protein N7G274_000679 [Stereocaulon virgatum]|uniref:VWFA domain-containing protein n=1 Tax=Stereocaulon virgatum TaxID=373712 RepID=A0ABR4APG0_9LECA
MKYTTTTVRGLPRGTTRSDVENYFDLSIDPHSPCVAGPVVDELQGNTCSTTVTFRNEKHGKHRTCESLKEYFNRSNFRGLSTTISVTNDFFGLTPLSGKVDASVHIYLVHGLGGHAFNTWASDVRDDNIETLRAWPRDFLPKRLSDENINARVYTLGYNANMIRNAAPDATVNSAAEDLLASLYGDRQKNHPREIYFVCHSLGGLIVCQALVMALFEDDGYPNKPEYRNLFVKDGECLIKGVIFMGTPFRGSGQATLFKPFIKAIRQLNLVTAVNDSFLGALNADQPIEITLVVHRFQNVMNAKGIKVIICCEEKPVAGSALTTSNESAVATFGKSALIIRIHKDHRGMVKFDDKSNNDYKSLENHIIKMINSVGQQRPTAAGESSNGGQAAFSGSPGSSPEHRNVSADYWQTLSSPRPLQTIHYNNYFGDNPLQHESEGIRVNWHQAGTSSVDHNTYTYQDLYGAQMDAQKRPPTRQKTFPHGPSGSYQPTSQQIGQLGAELDGISISNGWREPNIVRRSTVPNGITVNDDDDPFNRLIMFDTVFIVDDTGSMIKAARDREPEGQDRWAATAEALQHITQLAASKDPDGIDIRFLKSGNLNEDNITSVDTVMEILGLIDMYDGSHGGGTVFKEHLEDEISPRLELYRDYLEQECSYKENLRRLAKDRQARARLVRPKPPTKLNLIVITDGQADDRQEVEDYIVETALELDKLKAPTAQIGIQFVQIGEDASAREYLKRLDDDLKRRDPPIRDIVDTTPCDSHIAQGAAFQDVLVQVLLGAVTKDIDERNT